MRNPEPDAPVRILADALSEPDDGKAIRRGAALGRGIGNSARRARSSGREVMPGTTAGADMRHPVRDEADRDLPFPRLVHDPRLDGVVPEPRQHLVGVARPRQPRIHRAAELLEAVGRHGSRPAHIHFSVSASGHRHLATQINGAAVRCRGGGRERGAFRCRLDIVTDEALFELAMKLIFEGTGSSSRTRAGPRGRTTLSPPGSAAGRS